MSNYQRLSAYPITMLTSIDTVLTECKRVDLHYSSRKEAMKQRFRFYGLRKAIENSEQHPLKHLAPKLTIRILDSTLRLEHVDFTDDALAFAEVMKRAVITDPDDPDNPIIGFQNVNLP